MLIGKPTYDGRRRVNQWEYLTPDGKPGLHKNGFAKVAYKYYDRATLTEEAYFGTDGKPTNNTEGYAKISPMVDTQGKQTGVAYFDKEGKKLRTHLVIKKVVPGTQAERLGLKAGDVLATSEGEEFVDLLSNQQEEEKLRKKGVRDALTFRRDGKPFTIHPKPGVVGYMFQVQPVR